MTKIINATMSPAEWALLVFLSVLWGGSFYFAGVAPNRAGSGRTAVSAAGASADGSPPAGADAPERWAAWSSISLPVSYGSTPRRCGLRPIDRTEIAPAVLRRVVTAV